jgi:hypothetical protein
MVLESRWPAGSWISGVLPLSLTAGLSWALKPPAQPGELAQAGQVPAPPPPRPADPEDARPAAVPPPAQPLPAASPTFVPIVTAATPTLAPAPTLHIFADDLTSVAVVSLDALSLAPTGGGPVMGPRGGTGPVDLAPQPMVPVSSPASGTSGATIVSAASNVSPTTPAPAAPPVAVAAPAPSSSPATAATPGASGSPAASASHAMSDTPTATASDSPSSSTLTSASATTSDSPAGASHSASPSGTGTSSSSFGSTWPSLASAQPLTHTSFPNAAFLDAAGAPPGGIAEDESLSSGLFLGRPIGGTGGGFVDPIFDRRGPTPFDPPSGSGHGPTDPGATAFRTLDALVYRYIDPYFQGLNPNVNSSGSQSFSASGSDGAGSYNFNGWDNYSFTHSGTTTAHYSEWYNYDFQDSGVAADNVTISLHDNGAGSSLYTIAKSGGGAGQIVSQGSYTTSTLFTGTENWDLGESQYLAGSAGTGTRTDSVAALDVGSLTFTIVPGPTKVTGTNSFTLTGTANETDSNTAGGDSGSSTQSETTTESSSYGFTWTPGGITWDQSGSGGATSYEGGTESSSNTSGTDSSSFTLTDRETDSSSAHLSASETTSGSSTSLGGGSSPTWSYTWNGSGTDSFSTSDSAWQSSSESSTEASTLGGVTASATMTQSSTESSTPTESGTHTLLSLHETGTETDAPSNSISGGSDGYTWRDALTASDSLYSSGSESSAETATESSTLAGVTASDSSTDSESTTSTTTESGSDSHTLYETGTDTKVSLGLISSGNASDSLYETPTSGTSLHETGSGSSNGASNENSTPGGVAASSTITASDTETRTHTTTETGSSTESITLSETLGAGAIGTIGSSSDTVSDASTATDSLYTNGGATTTETDIESSTLGGVTDRATDSFSQTDSPTDTEVGTYTVTDLQSSSETQTSGTVLSGYAGESLYHTAIDPSSLYETGTETSGTGGIHPTYGGIDVSSSTLYDATTSENLTTTGSATHTATETAADSSTEAGSNTETLGLDALVTAGSATGNLYDLGSSTSSIYEVDGLATTVTSGETGTVQGVTSSESLVATQSETPTAAESATAHPTSTETTTQTLGQGGDVLGGTISDSLFETGTGSNSLSETGSETSTQVATVIEPDAGKSLSESVSTVESGSQTAIAGGTHATSQAEQGIQTLGVGEAVIGGNASDSLYGSGLDSHTVTQTDTTTVNTSSTETTSLGADDSTATASASEVDHATATESGTNPQTQTDTDTETLGSAGIVTTGTEWDLLYETASDQSQLNETGTETSTQWGRTDHLTGPDASTISTSETATESPTVSDSGSDATTHVASEIQVLGTSGTITGGATTDSLYDLGTETHSLYQTGIATETQWTSRSSSESSNLNETTITAVNPNTHTVTAAETVTPTATHTATAVLGTSGTVASGNDSDTVYETGTDSSTRYEVGTDTTTQSSSESLTNAADTTIAAPSSTETATHTATDSGSGAQTQYGSSTEVLGVAAAVVSGNASDSDYETGSDNSSLYETGSLTLGVSDNITQTASNSTLNETTVGTGSGSFTATGTDTGQDTGYVSGTQTFAAAGAFTGGIDTDSAYETANDSSERTGTTTETDTDRTSGAISNNSTITSTATTTETGTDSDTHCESGTESLTTGGSIAGGNESDSLTLSVSDGLTGTKTGTETLTAGNDGQTGTLTTTENSNDTSTHNEASTLTIGAGGTFTGGSSSNVYDLNDQPDTSVSETGTQSSSDDVAGGTMSAAFTKTSTLVPSLSEHQSTTETFGAGGSVSGGDDSYTWNEQDTDNSSFDSSGLPGSTSGAVETGTDSDSLDKTATETLGANDVIEGGSDGFTWDQMGTDCYSLSQAGETGGTVNYDLNPIDSVSSSWHDVGADTMTTGDVLAADSDIYTWTNTHSENFAAHDKGSPSTPATVGGSGTDTLSLQMTGSQTLQVGGTVTGGDTFTYDEDSNDTGDINSGNTSGGGDDRYHNHDAGTLWTDGTTSHSTDNFTVDQTHDVNPADATPDVPGAPNSIFSDAGSHHGSFHASGTYTTDGTSISRHYDFNSGNNDSDRAEVSQTDAERAYWVDAVRLNAYTDSDSGSSDLKQTPGNTTTTYSEHFNTSSYQSLGIVGALTSYGTLVIPFASFNYGGGWQSNDQWTEVINGVTQSPPACGSLSTYYPGPASSSGWVANSADYSALSLQGIEFKDATADEFNAFGLPPGVGGAVHPGTGYPTAGRNFSGSGPTNLFQLVGDQVARNLIKTDYFFDEIVASPNTVQIKEGDFGEWLPTPTPIGYRREDGPGSGFQPRIAGGTQNGTGREEFKRLGDLRTYLQEKPSFTKAEPETPAQTRVEIAAPLRDEPTGGNQTSIARNRVTAAAMPAESTGNWLLDTLGSTGNWYADAALSFAWSYHSNFYNGVKSLVTLEAGKALGERAVQTVEARTGKDFTGTDLEWDQWWKAVFGELSGVTPCVEAYYGFDIATMGALSIMDRIQRAAVGIGALAGNAAGGMGLLSRFPAHFPTVSRFATTPIGLSRGTTTIVDASAGAAEAGTAGASRAATSINPFEARLNSITARLNEHMQNAIRNAELTPRQVADIMKNGRASKHWGTQIDTRFKMLVETDPQLSGEVAVSPRGSPAPDVIDLQGKHWWDVTSTPEEFAKKPPKYGTQFGDGTPLLYNVP